MNDFVKKLLQFSIGPVFGAVIGFIMVPITTYFLAPAEIGRASMFTIVQNLLPTIYLGMDQAYTREFNVEKNKKNLFLNALFLPFLLSIIVFIFFSIQAPLFSSVLFGDDHYLFAIYLIGFTNVTMVFERFILLKVRMEEKALEFSVFSLILRVSTLILTLIFVLFIRTDFLAIIYATITGQLLSRFVLLVRYRSSFELSDFKLDKRLNKRLLMFGMPLIISVTLGSLLKISSNVALRHFSDFEQLGLFAAGVKVINLLLIIQTAFTLFWVPTAYKWHEEKRQARDYQLVSEMVLAVMSFVFILLLFFRKRVISGSVTVSGCEFLICSINNGITEPREAMTFPYLVPEINVLFESTAFAFAINTFSIIAFEMPIALIG